MVRNGGFGNISLSKIKLYPPSIELLRLTQKRRSQMRQTTIVPHLKPFRPRKWGESASDCLARAEKRLQQIQFELNNWITVPTNYGIQITHRLEDEKQLMLKVKALLLEEIGGDVI